MFIRRKWLIVGAIALVILFLLLAPKQGHAAASVTDIVTVFNAAIVGLVSLTKVAMCAVGVTAFC